MNLLSPSEVKALLIRHGIRPKKRLGQNFLIDRNVLNKIIEAGDIDSDTKVLEIGPGLGALTYEAARRAGKVVAVEMDRDMVAILGETLGGVSNVEVVTADFLSLNLDEFLPSHFGDSKCVVLANLPYYITSPLITRLIGAKERVARMVIMVQAEVAARLTAGPRSSDYGSLSVFVQYHCKVSVAAKVSRNVFLPPPEVDSSVVRLDMRDKPAVDTDEELFFKIVRSAFGQRRKTLLRALSLSPFLHWSRETTSTILEAANIDPIRRGETLSLEEFAAITDAANSIL